MIYTNLVAVGNCHPQGGDQAHRSPSGQHPIAPLAARAQYNLL